jgi:hypothetical protein
MGKNKGVRDAGFKGYWNRWYLGKKNRAFGEIPFNWKGDAGARQFQKKGMCAKSRDLISLWSTAPVSKRTKPGQIFSPKS